MCVSPLLPPPRVHQAWTRRREKLRTRPRRPRTHRRATRRRRRRRTRPPRRRRRRRRRPRPRPRRPRRRPAFGSAHVDQRPQILVFIGAARSPGMKPPRHSRIFVCRRTSGGPRRPPRASGLRETINRQDSITQAWTPEELAYAARVSDLYGRGVLPNCPAPTQCRISELWDDGVVTRERRRCGWITITNAGGHHAPRFIIAAPELSADACQQEVQR